LPIESGKAAGVTAAPHRFRRGAPSARFDINRTVHDIDTSIAAESKVANDRYKLALIAIATS
jgi:hypothetical protein